MSVKIRPRLPQRRGPISDTVIAALQNAPRDLQMPSLDVMDMLDDDDAPCADVPQQLAAS